MGIAAHAALYHACCFLQVSLLEWQMEVWIEPAASAVGRALYADKLLAECYSSGNGRGAYAELAAVGSLCF